MCMSMCERERVCERESLSVCVCVCVRERVSSLTVILTSRRWTRGRRCEKALRFDVGSTHHKLSSWRQFTRLLKIERKGERGRGREREEPERVRERAEMEIPRVREREKKKERKREEEKELQSREKNTYTSKTALFQ